tara:strand:- start:122 stop:304 length:183 start_codon:yes stop_codon:yes gene_type:complete
MRNILLLFVSLFFLLGCFFKNDSLISALNKDDFTRKFVKDKEKYEYKFFIQKFQKTNLVK